MYAEVILFRRRVRGALIAWSCVFGYMRKMMTCNGSVVDGRQSNRCCWMLGKIYAKCMMRSYLFDAACVVRLSRRGAFSDICEQWWYVMGLWLRHVKVMKTVGCLAKSKRNIWGGHINSTPWARAIVTPRRAFSDMRKWCHSRKIRDAERNRATWKVDCRNLTFVASL